MAGEFSAFAPHGLVDFRGSFSSSVLLRYTASSFRAVDEHPPYGSMPRLNDQPQSRHCSTSRLDSLSRHGSTQRLESQSRHGSIRDLSGATQAVLGVRGNGIHRVLEEDGATA